MSGSASYASFGGSASYSKSEIEAVGRAMCSSSTSESDVRSAQNVESSLIDPAAVAAFNQCLEVEDAGLKAVTTQGNPLTVALVFDGGIGSGTTPILFRSLAKPTGVNCYGSLSRLQENAPLQRRENYSITCEDPERSSSSGLARSIAIETSAGTIVRSIASQTPAPVAEPSVLSDVPVGTIVGAALSWQQLQQIDPRVTRNWQPADGRPVLSRSKLASLLTQGGTTEARVPDLRGVFLRGLNQFASDGSPIDASQADPDGNRAALSFQADAFQKHRHDFDRGGAPVVTGNPQGSGDQKRRSDVKYENGAGLMPLDPTASPGVPLRVAAETRPKNVAIYYYIRVN
jgi:hypothetical protein